MPQINLYQTEQDELGVVKAAFSEGSTIVPDRNYSASEAIALDTIEAFKHARVHDRHFFILNKRFSRLPIHFRKILKDGKPVYYISPSQGGPFLEFMGGGVITDDAGTRRIRSGFLACPSGYWNAEITRKEGSPPELAESFKRLSKAIRTTSTRIRPDQSVYWLGGDAKAQLEGGAKLGLHENFSFSNSKTQSLRNGHQNE